MRYTTAALALTILMSSASPIHSDSDPFFMTLQLPWHRGEGIVDGKPTLPPGAYISITTNGIPLEHILENAFLGMLPHPLFIEFGVELSTPLTLEIRDMPWEWVLERVGLEAGLKVEWSCEAIIIRNLHEVENQAVELIAFFEGT